MLLLPKKMLSVWCLEVRRTALAARRRGAPPGPASSTCCGGFPLLARTLPARSEKPSTQNVRKDDRAKKMGWKIQPTQHNPGKAAL
jgi:hypothetical protein